MTKTFGLSHPSRSAECEKMNRVPAPRRTADVPCPSGSGHRRPRRLNRPTALRQQGPPGACSSCRSRNSRSCVLAASMPARCFRLQSLSIASSARYSAWRSCIPPRRRGHTHPSRRPRRSRRYLATSSMKKSDSTLIPWAKSCFSLSKCALIVSRIWMRRDVALGHVASRPRPARSTKPFVNSPCCCARRSGRRRTRPGTGPARRTRRTGRHGTLVA